MKKSILLSVAVLLAATLSAENVININLADYQLTDANSTAVLSGDSLTVSYDLGAWGASGVEFALDNLDNITNIGFDFKGDASVETWVSFFPYLKDAAGTRFYSADANLNISTWMSEWSTKKYMPETPLWVEATPQMPYVAIGFLANPQNPTAATFTIRNVQVFTDGTGSALTNTQVTAKATKIIENGQVYILRDGVRYNLLGAVEQ